MSNPRVQLRIVLVFSLLALFYVCSACVMGQHILESIASESGKLPMSYENVHDLSVMLEQQRQVFVVQMMVFTFSTVTIFLLTSVLISHTIGGPIFQLNTYLRGVVSGDTPPRRIRFRRHDFFSDLAESFNEFQEHHGILPPADSPQDKDAPPAGPRRDG